MEAWNTQKPLLTIAVILTLFTTLVHPAAINNTFSSPIDSTDSSSRSDPSPESPTKPTDSDTEASYHHSVKGSASTSSNWLVGSVKPKTWVIGNWLPLSSSPSASAAPSAPAAPSASAVPSGRDRSDADPITGPALPSSLPIYPPYPSAIVGTAEEDDGTKASQTVGQPVQAQIECPEKSGLQAYAHPEECDQFYLCTNGTLTLERCQNGLLFKGGPGAVHNHCHYHWDVDCSQRHKDMVALSTESCEYQFGMYPEGEEQGCSSKYVVCEFGRAHVAECAPGLAYDPRTHRCNWPDEMLDLKCEPKNLLGFECPEGPPEDPVSARFWPYPRFALKGDCKRLITCVNGQPRLITCDPDMVVDDSTLTCEEPELVPSCRHLAKHTETEEDN